MDEDDDESPTREEIESGTRRIQAKWREEEFVNRYQGADRRIEWELPVCSVNTIEGIEGEYFDPWEILGATGDANCRAE